MRLYLFLIATGSIICQCAVVGHFVPKKNAPTENMNGEYFISNPNHASGKSYSTLYSSRPNVEYFDAYSPPISTRYIDTACCGHGSD